MQNNEVIVEPGLAAPMQTSMHAIVWKVQVEHHFSGSCSSNEHPLPQL